MMTVQKDRDKIREFFDLLEDEHYDLRKFSHPVLVYKVDGDKIYYSLWEESLLSRFGLENVDGWDYSEDVLFCPDWVQDDLDEDDFDDVDDEPLNIEDIKKYIDEE